MIGDFTFFLFCAKNCKRLLRGLVCLFALIDPRAQLTQSPFIREQLRTTQIVREADCGFTYLHKLTFDFQSQQNWASLWNVEANEISLSSPKANKKCCSSLEHAKACVRGNSIEKFVCFYAVSRLHWLMSHFANDVLCQQVSEVPCVSFFFAHQKSFSPTPLHRLNPRNNGLIKYAKIRASELVGGDLPRVVLNVYTNLTVMLAARR